MSMNVIVSNANGEIVSMYAFRVVQQLWFVWNAFSAVLEDARVLRRLLQQMLVWYVSHTHIRFIYSSFMDWEYPEQFTKIIVTSSLSKPKNNLCCT